MLLLLSKVYIVEETKYTGMRIQLRLSYFHSPNNFIETKKSLFFGLSLCKSKICRSLRTSRILTQQCHI
ncbi:hypothetical protein XENTR_v10018874 [Xenopus tropicalis]|nr:hypothetical protein XENTR_v10018874 [Xenopus tropicalis]